MPLVELGVPPVVLGVPPVVLGVPPVVLGVPPVMLGAPLVVLGAVPPVKEDSVVEVVLGTLEVTFTDIPMLLLF